MTEQLRIWAGLQGFLSLAALVALALFFALATPFTTEQSRWSWLGPVNDWLSVLGAVPWIVAMILVTLRMQAGAAMWVFTIVASVGVTALATVTLLMLAGRADLQAQTIVAIPATVIAFAWIAGVAPALRAVSAIPPWVSVLAIVLFVALLVGAAAAGVGFLAPSGSPVQTGFYTAGAVIGGLAWFAFPIWWLAVASTAA
ncbi:hypothetical protein [Mycetocola sp.]|uniref:hypothetical protein n=1 Tax=Mycetocola sp. TaxID=1871042 RepID=UPI00398997F2